MTKVTSNEFDTLNSTLPASSSSKPLEACACTIMRSLALSVTTLPMAEAAELEYEPLGVVMMLTTCADAGTTSSSAARQPAITLSHFMGSPEVAQQEGPHSHDDTVRPRRGNPCGCAVWAPTRAAPTP